MKKAKWIIIGVVLVVLMCIGMVDSLGENAGAGFIFFFVLLAIAGGGIALAKGIDKNMEEKMGKQGWEDFQKAVNDEKEKKKYNNYLIVCPICKSRKIKKISNANRATSVAIMGLASSKIGKQYECDSCHHKW